MYSVNLCKGKKKNVKTKINNKKNKIQLILVLLVRFSPPYIYTLEFLSLPASIVSIVPPSISSYPREKIFTNHLLLAHKPQKLTKTLKKNPKTFGGIEKTDYLCTRF